MNPVNLNQPHRFAGHVPARGRDGRTSVRRQAKQAIRKAFSMTTKLFTLHVDTPDHPNTFVQFLGIEYPTLQKACEANVGNYGFFHPVEILGRAFILSNDAALEFFRQNIPYKSGYSNGVEFKSWSKRFRRKINHIHWSDDMEIEETTCIINDNNEEPTIETDHHANKNKHPMEK